MDYLNENDFQKEVLEKKGIALVYFGATWCGPCKMVAPVIDEAAAEVEDGEIVKVNVDDSGVVASTYGIRSIPTFILFKDGEVVDRITGANPSKDFYIDLVNNVK